MQNAFLLAGSLALALAVDVPETVVLCAKR